MKMRLTHPLHSIAIGGVAVAAVAGMLLRSRAQSPPAAPPTLLQQLSTETQQLYSHATHSMVRVQLPTPQWLAQYNARQRLLDIWGPRLDPKVREQFIEDQERAMKELQHPSATQPTTRPLNPGLSQPFSGQMQVTDAPRPVEPALALFAVGLLVDDLGHAVLPVYVDHNVMGDKGWPAVTGEGELTTAKFVGSDAQTNLTVMQLEKHSGTPAALSHNRPEDGVLTLAIARDGSAKLIVWNNQRTEPGFAILTDGSVAGFGFENTFLGASTAKPVVDQLISTGEVHRAILGVVDQEVTKEDPVRRLHRELGTLPAIRILIVQDGSAAARGGIEPDDLILKIDNEPVGDPSTFAAVIAAKHGNSVLHVLRGEKELDLTVSMVPR